MTRYELINHLIQKYSYKHYLEIGVCDSRDCFDRIDIPFKMGVDPTPRHLLPGTLLFYGESDAFFARDFGMRFDIVFIDGLHQDFQVRRDIKNTLDFLKPNGIIVMHDCLPSAEITAAEEPDWAKSPAWCGTCWKAFAFNRMTRKDLSMFTIDTDCGCGIIRRGTQELVPVVKDLTWEYYWANRSALMNIKTVEEALKLL